MSSILLSEIPSCIAFIMLRYIQSILNIFGHFILKAWCCFSICWDSHVISTLKSIYMIYFTNQFVYVELTLHPWNETMLITMYYLLKVLLNFYSLLLRIFTTIFSREIGLQLSSLLLYSPLHPSIPPSLFYFLFPPCCICSFGILVS